MAKANSTPIDTPFARLKVKEYSWGKIYQGTQADLIDAGLVKAEWFPGPGTSKTDTRIALVDGEMEVLPFGKMATREQEENGLIRIHRKNKREFEAYIRFTQEELDRQNLRREVERQHAEKQRELDAAPKSAEEFLRQRKRVINGLLEVVLNYFRRSENGFHYSREIIEEANDLIAELCELAEDGKVYFDQKRQQYFLDDVEKNAEQAHPEFSAFMKATLAIGKAACP